MKSWINLFSKSKSTDFHKVALITNFSSCPLGMSLAKQICEKTLESNTIWDKILLVSPNAEEMKQSIPQNDNILVLNAFLNE